MKPYMTVASSGDNGYTWTDEYTVHTLDAVIGAINAHKPQCDGFIRVYWGPGEFEEYPLPLSGADLAEIRLMVEGVWPDGTPYKVEQFDPPVPPAASLPSLPEWE